MLQVCPFFAPHHGGVETHVEMVAVELVRRGHDVTVLTSQHDRSLPEQETTASGIHVVRSRTWGTYFATPLAVGTSRSLRTLPRPDVVHMHYPPPVTSYLVARDLRKWRVPTCLTYHCDLYLEGWVGHTATRVYQSLFLPPTLAVAQRIIVHTASYGKTSRALQGRSLDVIPSLVDTDRFSPRGDDPELRRKLGAEGKAVVLFVGRLVSHKGVEDLLISLDHLPKEALLVVVGEGPRREDLEGDARERGVADRVRFVGAPPDEEIPRYHALSSVVVLPSQNRLEGFGLAIVEAMASGRPVVVADLPGVRELITEGEDGLLAEPLLPEDLANKCAQLLADPERARRLGENARATALKKYRVGVVVDQLEALYRQLAASRTVAPR